jgi:hypothetical protein
LQLGKDSAVEEMDGLKILLIFVPSIAAWKRLSNRGDGGFVPLRRPRHVQLGESGRLEREVQHMVGGA